MTPLAYGYGVERAHVQPMGEVHEHACGAVVLLVETKLRSTDRGEHKILVDVPSGERHRCGR